MELDNNTVTAPKKRGRPRKEKPMVDANTADEVAAPVAKKRGRPRKTATVPDMTDMTDMADTTTANLSINAQIELTADEVSDEPVYNAIADDDDINDLIDDLDDDELDDGQSGDDHPQRETVDIDGLVDRVNEWIAQQAERPGPGAITAILAELAFAAANDQVIEVLIEGILGVWHADDTVKVRDRHAATIRNDWRREKRERAAALLEGDSDPEAEARTLLAELGIPDVEPWEHPVYGIELAHGIEQAFRRYITAEETDYSVLTTWTLHTFGMAVDAFRVSPRLAITSPQKGCGKTTLLDIVVELAYRGFPSADLTNATFFRVAHMIRPTTCIDERDRAAGQALDTLLNSGWSASSRGGTLRMEAAADGTIRPRAFRGFTPVALAGIGGIGASTLHDRCVEVQLHRQTDAERKAKFTLTEKAGLTDLPSKSLRWATDKLDILSNAPALELDGLSNRAEDNWSVLYAVAVALGGDWPERITAAAKRSLSRTTSNGDATNSIDLVRDIIRIAEVVATATGRKWHELKFSGSDLVKKLLEIDDGTWNEINGQTRKLTQNSMARMLRSFGVYPLRIDDADSIRGVTSAPTTIGVRSAAASTKSDKNRSQTRGYVMKDLLELRTRYLSDAEITDL
jgi:putative DNA primase/helicase